MNKLKIIAPVVGVTITSLAVYESGRQQSITAIEVVKIEANSKIEVENIETKAQMDRLLAKADLSKNPVKTEADPSNVVNNVESINSPLEIEQLKDLITNFDLSNLPFEILVGVAIFFGTATSLLCILFLAIYVSVYKLDLPFENYYSGYMLKLVNFVKPFSDWFIVFYLTILVSTQMILFILSLRLLSGY
jgi:hypothetical protein